MGEVKGKRAIIAALKVEFAKPVYAHTVEKGNLSGFLNNAYAVAKRGNIMVDGKTRKGPPTLEDVKREALQGIEISRMYEENCCQKRCPFFT